MLETLKAKVKFFKVQKRHPLLPLFLLLLASVAPCFLSTFVDQGAHAVAVENLRRPSASLQGASSSHLEGQARGMGGLLYAILS